MKLTQDFLDGKRITGGVYELCKPRPAFPNSKPRTDIIYLLNRQGEPIMSKTLKEIKELLETDQWRLID